MKLDQPISLHTGALKGSNSSITWNFLTSMIKVVAENLNGSSYNVKIIKIQDDVETVVSSQL